MKNKMKNTNIVTIILLFIAVILTLFILSNVIKAAKANPHDTAVGETKSWEELIDETNGYASMGEFARYIAYHPNEFLDDRTANDIFGLNKTNAFHYTHIEANWNDWKCGCAWEPLMEHHAYGHMDFSWYKSAICLFANQGTVGGALPRVLNVVEIESPGTLQVYGNGDNVEYVTVNPNASGVIVPEEDEQNALSSLAYILYQATIWERQYDGNTDNLTTENWSYYKNAATETSNYDFAGTFSADISSDENINTWNIMCLSRNDFESNTGEELSLSYVKAAISYLMFKESGGSGQSFKDILMKYAPSYINTTWASGIENENLVSTWYNYVTTKEDASWDTLMKNYVGVAQDEALNCKVPTYEKGETTPTITYDEENNLAYIGPLVLNFSNGSPSVEIEGVSEDLIKGWTSLTKAEDGTINWGSLQAISGLQSGSSNEIYIVADAEAIESLENIKIRINLEYNIYKAKMVFTAGLEQNCQNGMFYASKFEKANVEVEWEITQGPEVANLEIIKTGEDETKLENVQFVIKRDNSGFIQLKSAKGSAVSGVKANGEIKINEENMATATEYQIEIVSDQTLATKFSTNSEGKITITNLPIYSSYPTKYEYTACEIYNPYYGYGSPRNTSTTGSSIKLELKEEETATATISVVNRKDLGNLKLTKHDESNHDIVLPNVEFVIEATPSTEKSYAYLRLRDKRGTLVKTVEGTTTINKNNIANDTGYKLEYYYTDKPYMELSDKEKNLITKFITDSKGTITVNNLEVYSQNGGAKYSYKLIEVKNNNYGYSAEGVELGNITIETNTTTEETITNKPTDTKISGYVWLENSTGKANKYDGVYTEKAEDQKLTNLYVTGENGSLVQNTNATIKVEIKLRDKKLGTIVKQKPDEFSQDGLYTFTEVKLDKLSDYEVVFVYDGFYYTTLVAQNDKDNGSKAEEISSERQTLSNQFDTVKNNNQVVSADGTINTVEYTKDGHTSTVSNINFETTISASTGTADYSLEEAYKSIKSMDEGIENVNLGIVLREQPKLSINSDIYSALIEFEGYKYNYKYNGRQNYYENKNGDDIGVKFEENYTAQRYTRPIYASDIQAAKDQNKEIKLQVTYKLQLANESKTLSMLPKQIINYFDSRYEIKAIGLGIDQNTHQLTDLLTYSEAQAVEGHSEYKSTIINFDQTIKPGKGNIKDIYITFNVSREAILDLLNEKSTYHNASEILSYSTYYGKETSQADGKQFISDKSAEGSIYAGIDKMSAPGNMEIVLKDHPTAPGTKIPDTTNFEDDTTSAPSLLLEATEGRKISGTVWEDTDANTNDQESKGNGILDSGEKLIANVQVELYKVNADGSIGEIAKYSDGQTEVKTKTDSNGNYTFGYKDSVTNKYMGILPGRYVIKYIYNNESYIVGGQSLNVNDYKSTIITSKVIKDAFESSNEKWYAAEEGKNYSDARDDISLRPEYKSNVDANVTVTNSTYNNFIGVDKMNAYTPVMDIGIEFTNTDESNALTLELVKNIENIDFGIIKRAKIDMTIEKDITGLEITAQNGANIIPKGNPSDPNEKMQYVRKLDGLITAELETDLLQGAKLSLEYTIKVINNSQIDYLEKEYYYYGTGGRTELTSRAKQVADYLDGEMTLDSEKNESIWEVKTADVLRNAGYVSENVYKALKDGKYNIVTTTAFEEVAAGAEKTLKLYATKYLAVDDDISEENHVEIIELTGRRTIEGAIPGNYNPTTGTPDEKDDDKVAFVVTPPTGINVNYVLYIIATLATLSILVVGVVLIKKKIIK